MLRNDEKFKQNLLKALHDMDIDIVDYRYDEDNKAAIYTAADR